MQKYWIQVFVLQTLLMGMQTQIFDDFIHFHRRIDDTARTELPNFVSPKTAVGCSGSFRCLA